jgi:hypothetical protein
LRRLETPLKCSFESNLHRRMNNGSGDLHDSRQRLPPECEDCGDHPLSCRCNPGEG